jgi:hypothetical protein
LAKNVLAKTAKKEICNELAKTAEKEIEIDEFEVGLRLFKSAFAADSLTGVWTLKEKKKSSSSSSKGARI